MKVMTYVKWFILVALIACSAALTLPFEKRVRLGLDIQGGYSFTLELDKVALEEMMRERYPKEDDAAIQTHMEEAIRNANEVAADIIRNRIDPLGTEEPVITKGKDNRIYVQMPGATPEKRAEAERMVRRVAFLEFRLVHAQNSRLVQQLLDSGKAPNGYVVGTGSDGREYWRRTTDYGNAVADPAAHAREVSRFGRDLVSGNYACLLEQVRVGSEDLYRPVFVLRRAEMTGENLKHAYVEFDEYNRPQVALAFNAQGARDFARVTGKYCPDGTANQNNSEGRQLAIILDNMVYSAPVIKTRIDGGRAVITGSFTTAEANSLRTILNAGALPAPLKFMGQRFVAPTVGEDAIAGAKKAFLIGIGAILLFMLLYYTECGFVADIAVLLDIILLPLGAAVSGGFLGLFAADASAGGLGRLPVLTLPGIAGVLLTFGMAVDGNVLIFERIREELKSGKRLSSAVDAGFERAGVAILDSNITTVLTAVILFVVGTGLIRGFAVMLTAGVIVSMYTILVVTRMIFKCTVTEDSKRTFKMLKLVPDGMNFDFIGNSKKYIALIVAVIVVTLGVSAVRGVKDPARVFAVDFTGGAKITYSVNDRAKAPVDQIRAAAAAIGVNDANPQYQTDAAESSNTGATYLEIKTVVSEIGGRPVSEALTAQLQSQFAEAGIDYLDMDAVGSQIGKELKRSAVWATILALLGIIVYITVRFEFGFAVGAITALVHDVLATIGIYLILGHQINLTIVAAILTIVGYSVNDTIVVFDRVREELRRDHTTDMATVTNKSLNVTLSRTVLTTITTLITTAALYIFSAGDIRDFALTMLIGLVVGTLSTIFLAVPVALRAFGKRRPFASGK